MNPGPSTPQHQKAAYGGENWSQRILHHREEIGSLWASCGLNSEWRPLKQVLLHPPGPELAQTCDPEAAQFLVIPDWELARGQHEAIAAAYREHGVTVHFVEPDWLHHPI